MSLIAWSADVRWKAQTVSDVDAEVDESQRVDEVDQLNQGTAVKAERLAVRRSGIFGKTLNPQREVARVVVNDGNDLLPLPLAQHLNNLLAFLILVELSEVLDVEDLRDVPLLGRCPIGVPDGECLAHVSARHRFVLGELVLGDFIVVHMPMAACVEMGEGAAIFTRDQKR